MNSKQTYSITTSTRNYNVVPGYNLTRKTWKDNTQILRMYKFNKKNKEWTKLKI